MLELQGDNIDTKFHSKTKFRHVGVISRFARRSFATFRNIY
ncbi:unnamed protein product [Cuscuta europaea]|uniref:Uncharacterized protein n=1 Tax=Cuscuta europaea TaxID=41803 RepID=A0A9P0YRI5_CUSEU|nr:unnamed protein product [Cuscuta europaea]